MEKTRREFLKCSLAAAAGAVMLDPRSGASDGLQSSPLPEAAQDGSPLSRVIRVVSDKVLPLRTVQRPHLKDCITQGLRGFTGLSDTRDAWHRLLQPDDVVLIKFSQSGADQIGTTPPMVAELFASLNAAGWAPEQLMLLEAGAEDETARKTRPPDLRWQGREVRFGQCGQDSLLAALDQATAIINVPFLKTHHLATMTCALKNLSHGLIRHPARFHANGCNPAIAEIVASEPIKNKMRLTIVNALRVVADLAPEIRERDLHAAGTLFFGTDAVACDAAGYGLLNEIRSLRHLPPLLPDARLPAYMATAARMGLGQVDSARIDIRRVDL